MNKIYKVIWSKAKHCYVVTSELAKRNTKGCGTRGLRMAAATLGVAAALIGGVTVPSAWAEGTTITVTGANDPIGTADPADSMGRTGSYYHPVSGSVTEVVITGGVDKSSYYFTGGYSSSEDVTGHTVQVSGAETSVRCLYGGYSESGTARGNKILDTEAKFQSAYGGCGAAAIGNAVEVTGANIGYWDRNYSAVCGGRSRNGSASANTVKLSNSTVYYVYGGFSSNGAAGGEEKKNGNIVTLENNSRVYNKVYGGYVSYINSDNIENAIASNNTVTIDGSTAGDVYGGSINYFYSGVANANTVFIKNASEVTSVIGGDSSEANNNRVEITGSVVVNAVIGGKGGKSSNDNEVYISGIMEGKEYTVGGDVYGGGAPQQSNGNTVTVTNGGVVAGYIYGARSSSGSEVKDNKVFIEKGAVAEKGIIGGYGYYTSGNVTSGNEVLIEDSTVTDASFDSWSSRGGIIGGFSSSYSATDNHVTIKNSAIGGDSPLVAGGRSFSPLTGDCIKDNTATVTNVNSEKLAVYGGLGYDGWRYNSDFKVNLENNVATVDSSIVGLVSGGYTTGTGYSKGNTAIIKNSTVRTDVYGGYSWNGECTGNTVVLDGATVGGSVLGGGNGYPDMVTGNTLMLSGTNTVDGYVRNFETIKLADTLTWSDGAVVLKMGEIYNNYNGTRPSLDIRDAETNLGTASGGQMTLLSCDETNSYKNLSLIYSGSAEPVALDESNQSQVVKAGVETPESSPVNGVTLTYASSHLVSLDADNSYKNILYKVESLPSKITLGDMTWGTGRDLAGAFTFGSGAVVDATNLTFGDITTALSVNDSMVLAVNATGITSAITPTEGNNKTVKIKDYTDSATGIGYEATAKGNVTTATDAVKYTVSSVTADKITLASRAWGAAADTLPDTWTASASTQIDATNFAYTGEATTALKVGEVGATILNAKGLTTDSPVTAGTDKTVGVNYTDDAGVTYTATASGHVASAADAVNYVVDSVAVNSVDLSNWNGTGTSAVTNGWTGSGVAVATGSFAAPTDLAAGSARDIVTASAGFFTDDAITGANKYGNGETFTETEQAGVTLAGHKVGGVKADADGAKLTYYAMNKTGDTLTLGEAKFVANGTVAKYGSEYDLTAAAINADGLKFTEGQDAMKAGAVMTVVDATGAVKSGGASLVEFAGKTYEVDFTDAIDDTILTLTGKHTDTLTQDEGKTKLTYTVGDKNVDTAAFAGSVGWNQGSTYYTNTKYTFSDATKIDASGLSVTGSVTTALTAGDAMTLLSAEGITADNRVTQPTASDGIAVAYKNQGVAFNAVASGEVKAETGAVKYEVIGVALNTTDLAGWNGSAAASVPTGWTLASGATIETDGMTAPDVEAGNHVDIVKSDADGFFASATINGANKYKAVSFNEKDGGITFKGSQSKGVTLNEEKNHIIYASGTKDVATATVTGTIAWDTGKVYYENTKYTFGDTSKTDISGVKFTADTDPLNQSMTLITNAAGTVTEGSPEFTLALRNTSLKATATGAAAIDSGNLKYTVTGVTLDKVSVSDVGSDAVPEGWSVSSNVAVDTDSMTVPTDVAAGEEKAILTASGANVFSEENITGSNAYKESKFTENSEKASDTKKGVTVSGTQGKGVTVGDEGKSLVYKVGKKEADAVTLGAVDWKKGETLFDGSSATEYDYANVTAVDAGKFDVTYASPETVAAGESMTLLKANATLKAIVDEEKTKAYSFAPVSGVTVDAAVTGRLANSGNNVVFTAAENKASKLTFGDVEWKNSGALMARPSNIIFAGADVDTSKINFYKEIYLDADQKMTLVSDFGDKVGTITGSKYRVGTAFEGEGEASLFGSDLIFTTKTSAGVSEQTHKAVMAAEVGVAALNVGSDYIGKALESMGDLANVAPDRTTVGAAIGGGRNRYETGSHVNVNSWNAAVAVGAKRELKNGSLEYGLFGEYGKANYTLHSEVGQSDGDTHYAGGGLMAKWTNKHDVYAEASFRLGRMSDSTNDLLRDGAGNAYGYDIHANYYGAHAGVGKIFRYKGGKSLDVYGKYFYTKRDGVEFDAVQHYNLDSVKSSILRIGARYGTTDKKWNWYGGLAYEYEFDGESKGTVKDTAIRAASIKGSSVRGEIGMKMNATKTNPWQVDVSLYGYGGKHRGFGGNVNVAYMF